MTARTGTSTASAAPRVDAADTPSAKPGRRVIPVSMNQAGGEWGNLKGRFIYNGKAPTPQKLEITKDQDYCGKPPALVDESLLVGEDGGLANVVVWVRTRNVKVHPDVAAAAKKPGVIDNKHCRFEPRIVTLAVGQPMEVKNSDPPPVAHNTSAMLQANVPFNFQIPAESAKEMKPLTQSEARPVQVSCTIHPWMKGWLLVQPHPYMAVSDEKGNFELKDLPVGTELEFQVWQERVGNVAKANVGGKDTAWALGRFKMTIKPGDNDLGEIKIDPSAVK